MNCASALNDCKSRQVISIFFGMLLKQFPQLTLFPRVSETSETNLRNQRFFMLFGHIIHPRAVL